MVRLLKLGLVVLAVAWGFRFWRQNDPERSARAMAVAAKASQEWMTQARKVASEKFDTLLNQLGADKAQAQQIGADNSTGGFATATDEFAPPADAIQRNSTLSGVPVAPTTVTQPVNWANGPTPQREPPYDSRTVPRPWIRYPETSAANADPRTAGVAAQPTAQYPSTGYPATSPSQYEANRGAAPPTAASRTVGPAAASSAQPPLPWETFPWESTEILGQVNGEWILAADIMGSVNRDLYAELKNQPRERLVQGAAQIEVFRMNLIKAHLRQVVEARVVVADCKRKVPDENMDKIKQEIYSQFNKTEIKEMLKEANASTAQELDAHLRATGSSLEREKRTFFDFTLAHMWIRQNVTSAEEVTHDELVAYYDSHIAEFEFPAKARWEQVSVRLVHYSTKQQAYTVAAAIGNQIFQGARFEDAAKIGPRNAYSNVDWTTKGSLVSAVIDDAVFQLPVSQLSPILEDEKGFHIVRVTEREEAHRTPFRDAQVGIRKKIIELRDRAAKQQFVAKAREKVEISTIFDQPGSAGTSATASDAGSVYR